MQVTGRHAYESSKPRWQKPTLAKTRKQDDKDSDAQWLRCIRCGAEIACESDRVERQGLHEHSQINPHGFIWVFGCFADAPGTRALGELTSEFTWFVGYRWRVCECSGCALHLGWPFIAEEPEADQFWALISDRLVA